MKKLFLLFSLLAFAASVQAQRTYSSPRMLDLSQTLNRQTSDLANRTYQDLRRGSTSSRSDIDAAFLASQLDAGARLFEQMVRDSRNDSELRDAAAIISDLSRRAPNSYGSNGYLWRNVQNAMSDIQRELGLAGNGNGGWNGGSNGDGDNRPVIGRVTWRGKVDIETQLFIKGDSLETRVISGPNLGGEGFNFTSPLPSRKVQVSVNMKKGRGDVRILQQPSRENDFTAVIQILDPKASYKDYELEIYWR